MKPSSLQALIIDRHSGELSPEAAELLDFHLSQYPEARAQAERALQAIHFTREAVIRHPELVRGEADASASVAATPNSVVRGGLYSLAFLARVAAVAIVAAAVGFLAGRSAAPIPSPDFPTARQGGGTVAEASTPHRSPWAQYRMSFDSSGEGVKVRRIDY